MTAMQQSVTKDHGALADKISYLESQLIEILSLKQILLDEDEEVILKISARISTLDSQLEQKYLDLYTRLNASHLNISLEMLQQIKCTSRMSGNKS